MTIGGTYLFVHWGLKFVQLVKTAPKHDRCIIYVLPLFFGAHAKPSEWDCFY